MISACTYEVQTYETALGVYRLTEQQIYAQCMLLLDHSCSQVWCDQKND